MPCHVRGAFAVYEVEPGRFWVTRNGEGSGRPFETSDFELARIVCGRWAVEFADRL